MPPANPGHDATLERWWQQHSELDQLVPTRTKRIALRIPNNPTGARLEAPTRRRSKPLGPGPSSMESMRGSFLTLPSQA